MMREPRTELILMVNYIVSGLERSGTSMMMQILLKGGFPIAYDEKRKPDENNPKGYFELEGGKIINRLMEGTFDFDKYDGKCIKITAYGLKFLPKGRKYKIIYMVREPEEVFASMEKMSGKPLTSEEKMALLKLNEFCIKLMKERDDIDFIIVRYNDVLENPRKELERVKEFLDGKLDIERALEAIDPSLYRMRKEQLG